MVKVIVLSLKGSDRRNIVGERLRKCGVVDFIFFDAIDARKMNREEMSQFFNLDGFKKRYAREAANGEVGCTLSHVEIWKIISESNFNQWIVIEDDAILMPWFKMLFKRNNFPNKFTLIGYSKYPILKGLIYNLLRVIFFKDVINRKYMKGFYTGKRNGSRWGFGTVGYTITKDVAHKLLGSLSSPPDFLADDFELYEEFMDIDHVRPFMVYEDYKSFNSTIETNRKKEQEKGK